MIDSVSSKEADLVSTANNPFAGLNQLATVIIGIDNFIDLWRERRTELPLAETRRLIYMRNTLVVAFNLWKDDVEIRVARSQEKFYVFCMTDGEKMSFLRRMGPGFVFAAEELRDLNIKALSHFSGSIAQCSDAADHYANNNKICIRAGTAHKERFGPYLFEPMRLPQMEIRA